MWEFVTDARVIHRAQQQLARAFGGAADDRVRCFAGYQGGNHPVTALWSNKLQIWFGSRQERYKVGRIYWNAFGANGKPHPGENKTITCEINLGYTGRTERLAGAIAADERGRLHLMHTGRIGGGRRGIGRTLFQRHFRGEFVEVAQGVRISQLALAGDFNSPRLAYQVAHFVREVQRIKQLAGQAKTKKQPTLKFSSEPESRKGYRPSNRTIHPSADHGLVVNALEKVLTARGLRVHNDRNRDLFVTSANGAVQSLFEVKTSTSVGDIYQAIGQLFYNSATNHRKPELVLVSPRLSKMVVRLLMKLAIYHVSYTLSGSDARFVGLSSK